MKQRDFTENRKKQSDMKRMTFFTHPWAPAVQALSPCLSLSPCACSTNGTEAHALLNRHFAETLLAVPFAKADVTQCFLLKPVLKAIIRQLQCEGMLTSLISRIGHIMYNFYGTFDKWIAGTVWKPSCPTCYSFAWGDRCIAGFADPRNLEGAANGHSCCGLS